MTRLAIPPDIRFGVGGFPLAFTERPEAKDRGAVFAWLRSVGLDAIELQMTYGPRMTAEQGRRYRALAIADDIKLSIHGSYYIVLASPDPAKVLRLATSDIDTLDPQQWQDTYSNIVGSSIFEAMYQWDYFGRPPEPVPDTAAAAPATLHLGFLDAPPPQPDLAKLARLRQASERFQLLDRVFYLHAPEGVGRSKLAAGAEKALGVPMTDRNWRTVEKIWALAGKAAG